jgi:glycosyltransferase involved in cell wall biosynthesis
LHSKACRVIQRKFEAALSLNKVLMVFSNSYEGHYARDLANGFNQNGIEIAFVSLSGAKVPQWVGDFRAKDFSSNFQAKQLKIWKLFLLFRLIVKYKPSIIQTHLFLAGIFGLVAGKLSWTPVVHTRHHIDEHYQSGTFVHRWFDRSVAKGANHVIVCSAAAKIWLIEVEGIEKSHISVINQGFNFEYLTPSPKSVELARSDLDFSADKVNIICVARYSRAKGQNYLLLALSEIIKVVPNISLTFMGPGDSKWLVEYVDSLDLGKYVRILPSRDDIPACISAADMVVHPSLADSFSQLIIEVQAVGGLLIATDIAAAREQIIDGVTGVIVAPRSPNAIIEAVLNLIHNPELSKNIRVNGPSHVRENFAFQRMVDEEIECLRKFVK